MSRPVRFNIHPIAADIKEAVGVAEAPEGYAGEGFFTTQLSSVVGLARKNSMWPLPFATSCCGIEFMATMASHYDLARFGAERVGFSPRQCDLLMVMGTIAKKMGPVLRQVYLQMAEPRWVIAVGACASSGGIFDSYSVLQGIDQIIRYDGLDFCQTLNRALRSSFWHPCRKSRISSAIGTGGLSLHAICHFQSRSPG
jgi:NADH-quinone oxidoreductase subunit B